MIAGFRKLMRTLAARIESRPEPYGPMPTSVDARADLILSRAEFLQKVEASRRRELRKEKK